MCHGAAISKQQLDVRDWVLVNFSNSLNDFIKIVEAFADTNEMLCSKRHLLLRQKRRLIENSGSREYC